MNNFDGKQFITLTDDDLVQISGGGAIGSGMVSGLLLAKPLNH